MRMVTIILLAGIAVTASFTGVRRDAKARRERMELEHQIADLRKPHLRMSWFDGDPSRTPLEKVLDVMALMPTGSVIYLDVCTNWNSSVITITNSYYELGDHAIIRSNYFVVYTNLPGVEVEK